MQSYTIKFLTLASLLVLTACSFNQVKKHFERPVKTVFIYKSDGSRQCHGEGISVDDMQRELGEIPVYDSSKQSLNGMMYPAVCGGMTGNINVYEISPEDLELAKERGFEELPNPEK